ncbi:MAG: thioredoxin family protein [Verrucomicrobiota bacterium]
MKTKSYFGIFVIFIIVAVAGFSAYAESSLPRLLDLGAGKCVPCKMMKPILEEIKKEYDGKLLVEFIDVWENRQAGKEYGVRMIPTQIFYDASGKEIFRHEGFFSKEDILSKWKELGVELQK